jgi:hypothetical protein
MEDRVAPQTWQTSGDDNWNSTAVVVQPDGWRVAVRKGGRRMGGGLCNTPTRGPLVGRGIFVILHACMSMVHKLFDLIYVYDILLD